MARLNMSNNVTTPRISFSNDFLDLQHPIKVEKSYREAPVSSDFEFSVRNYSMISADEVFLNGKMMPLREENSMKATTLRDQLLAGDDDYEDVLSMRLAKGTSRWKERLGLKRSHNVVVKKVENCGQALGRIDEIKCENVVDKFKGERRKN